MGQEEKRKISTAKIFDFVTVKPVLSGHGILSRHRRLQVPIFCVLVSVNQTRLYVKWVPLLIGRPGGGRF